MKISKIVAKKDEVLKKDLSELKKRLEEARFKISIREEKNVKKIKALKKDIARIMTILREREIVAQETAVSGPRIDTDSN